MTFGEFMAWLDGFSEGFEAPNPEQWAKIKAKLETVVLGKPANPISAQTINPYVSNMMAGVNK